MFICPGFSCFYAHTCAYDYGYDCLSLLPPVIAVSCHYGLRSIRVSPEELLVAYMNHIPLQEYDEMYAMLSVEASGHISREDFVERNAAIYEGIGISNLTVTVLSYDKEHKGVMYETAFDTTAGKIEFQGNAYFLEEEEGSVSIPIRSVSSIFGLVWIGTK